MDQYRFVRLGQVGKAGCTFNFLHPTGSEGIAHVKLWEAGRGDYASSQCPPDSYTQAELEEICLSIANWAVDAQNKIQKRGIGIFSFQNPSEILEDWMVYIHNTSRFPGTINASLPRLVKDWWGDPMAYRVAGFHGLCGKLDGSDRVEKMEYKKKQAERLLQPNQPSKPDPYDTGEELLGKSTLVKLKQG